MIAKLRAVPGVHPAQFGDDEAAFRIVAGDAQPVRAVAALLRLRQRRAPAGVPLSPERARALAARLSQHRATSGAETPSARVRALQTGEAPPMRSCQQPGWWPRERRLC